MGGDSLSALIHDIIAPLVLLKTCLDHIGLGGFFSEEFAIECAMSKWHGICHILLMIKMKVKQTMAIKSMNNKVMDPKRIQEIRRRLRVTQEDFAHMVGVTFSTVNRWENGKSKPNRIAQRILAGLEKKVKR